MLCCVDPLTGEVLWSRTDLPAVCELFGDSRKLFAKSPTASNLLVFDMTDGSSLEEVPLPHGSWLTSSGSKLGIIYTNQNRELFVQIHDFASEEILFEAAYKSGTRIQILEPDTLAIMDPDGYFQYIDVSQARVVLDFQTSFSEPALAHYTFCDNSTLFLFVQHSMTQGNKQFQPFSSGNEKHPIFSGFVYALDLATGKSLWPVPASVRNQGLFLNQPAGSPILLFASRQITRVNGKPNDTLHLLCLDKSSGRSVYQSHDRINTNDGFLRQLVKQKS
ncbi:MAG: PQQ-binding-like beta-propeller repeat protein, partial [Gammaproteobacteria bacterium]|nr:PQQ-binding-like beta-propeller repeat protein [Gammaproteobacteria bacterium]